MIKWLTGADQVADRCSSSGGQLLIKWMIGTIQVADRP